MIDLTFAAAKVLLFFDICKPARIFMQKTTFFAIKNLHISKFFCTFAADFRRFFKIVHFLDRYSDERVLRLVHATIEHPLSIH
jgi:hypothetical protein